MINAEAEFYRHGYAAVHRGIHTLSAEATARMEQVRQQGATFLNARSAEELVFVRGTTEGINLVANSWGNANVGAGDNIIVSAMEHHANIVPWQMLCARVGAELRVIPLNQDGTLQLDAIPGLFDERTRLLAITQVSNVLGTENPVAALVALAHQHGAKVLVDGAQAVMHHPVDVQALDCDFYAFSAHKLYGPTGIGMLYVADLTLYGPQNRLGVIAFNLGKHHAYDVGSFLDNYGIAVRTGHHCAMPLMEFYGVPAMCRASLAMYNTTEEVDRLVAGLQRIHKLLS